MNKDLQAYVNLIADLNRIGLNLQAAFDLTNLPDIVADSLPTDAPATYKSLLLVGTKGSDFWQYLNRINATDGHCFDRMSESLTIECLKKYYPGITYEILYPSSSYVLPLQQLGRQVGWGRASILGLDIHPQYGTWFAYRTAMLVSHWLPPTPFASVDPVCENCEAKPCQPACPAGAVEKIGHLNLSACMSYRVETDSPCVDRCLSRLACPVGKDYFYDVDHLAHHSRFSLASIKRYKQSKKC